MPRIVGVDIPGNKRTVISLTYIFGIGSTKSKLILKEADISEDIRAKDLSEDELSRLTSVIERSHTIEGQLRRQVSQNISRLREIRCYRGEQPHYLLKHNCLPGTLCIP